MPRAWGVLCGQPSVTATVRFAPDALGAGLIAGGAKQWGLVGLTRAGGWATLPIDPNVSIPAVRVADACAGALGLGGEGDWQLVTTQATTVLDSVSAPVYLFEEVQYSIDDSPLGGQTRPWVYRTMGGNKQVLAGPLANEHGLTFRYFDRNGIELAQPISGADVWSVQVKVQMKSSSRLGKAVQLDSDSTIVDLRNAD